MAEDPKLARDDARRREQHADVKSELAAEVDRAIVATTQPAVGSDRAEIASVGRELEHRAVREVAETEHEIARGRKSARGAQIVDYIFYVIYALIAVEIALEAAGARDSNGFKGVMDTLTLPFLAPFRGLFADPAIGQYRFMFSYLAALVVWILVHLAIRGLLRVIGKRSTTL
ncbi:MAG: hypothetical protein U1F43_22005 [Myxococcota bacterium]